MKIVVYTCLTNKYDNLATPKIIEDDVDYIVFTDNHHYDISPPWMQRKIKGHYRNPRVQSRHPKINPHLYLADYDTSIYVDAMFHLKGEISSLAKEVFNGCKIAFFKHPERKCIYDEAEVVKTMGKDIDTTVNHQMMKYRELNYPEDHDLIAGGFIVRDHNDINIKKTMEIWWEEILLFSQRDQLSCNFALWTQSMHYLILPGVYWNNKFVEKIGHNHIDNYVTNKVFDAPVDNQLVEKKGSQKAVNSNQLNEYKNHIRKLTEQELKEKRQLIELLEKYNNTIKINYALSAQNAKILDSTSWKISSPMRRLGMVFRRIKNRFKAKHH